MIEWLTVVNDVGYQIVGCAGMRLLNFGILGQELAQIHVANLEEEKQRRFRALTSEKWVYPVAR